MDHQPAQVAELPAIPAADNELTRVNLKGNNPTVVAFFLDMHAQQFNQVVRYHEETKHHYDRYAKSLGYMDWENQPNPFRTYQNTTIVPLPLLSNDPPAGHLDLYQRSQKSPQTFSLENVAGFLELSLGLSAWKAAGGSKWALRMNPSSGNLHPTEGYLLMPPMDSIQSGVYHYNALTHALEKRAGLSARWWQQVESHFGTKGFFIGICSIFWRESWKYGERAFRYCNHDVGHALAALSLSANLFGWKASYLNALSDEAIENILDLGKKEYREMEREHPDCLCYVYPYQKEVTSRHLPDETISGFKDLSFSGDPNQLSPEYTNWEIIYKTAALTRKPVTENRLCDYGHRKWFLSSSSQFSAAEIIRKRRSATSFDRNGSVTKDQFLSMLDKTLPRDDICPFDMELMQPATHLFLFVHHVAQMPAGLYFFFRNETDVAEIKQVCKTDFLWKPVEDTFPLFLLKEGNFRRDATMVSCHQEIAGYSAFSLGMITKFKDIIAKEPYRYRHLFWETGMIGQVLYLEAEAHGFRGTGIGCFFDDAVHEMLGFNDNQYQSLYHFTIGAPVEDPRLTTYPPYHHLKNR
ncbi:MAG: SagB/ThcOx family dehydrogenase [Desulfobacteraceae bacterium]